MDQTGQDGSGSGGRAELLRVMSDHAVAAAFLALVVATYFEPSLAGDDGNPALHPLDGWWLLAGIAAAAALIFRRTHPLPAVLVVVTAVTVVAIAPYDMAPIAWTLYVAAFSLGRYAPGRHALVALAAFVASVAVTWPSKQGITATDVAFVLAFVVLAWFAGREVGRWRQRATLEADLAARRLELERQALQLAVTRERLHIAQELHDVVAHSFGAIAVQAGMAEAAFDARPDEARRAIGNILTTSRTSLGEIRRILGVLRHDPENPTDSSPPSMRDLPALLHEIEASGLAVESSIDVGVDVPASTGLAVYRIVQQALSNVLQHAHAAHVSATVATCDDAVRVEIVDDGRGAGRAGASAGYGLVGMRERALAHDGEFRAGPAEGGGFRVTATIPHGAVTRNPTGSRSSP